MSDRSQQREDAKSKISARAQKDAAFKAKLISDPRQAIESELKVKLPAGVQFHVVQETATSLYVVLPEEKQDKLSDQDLESVSGGATDVLANMY